jgi:hypothetical protein
MVSVPDAGRRGWACDPPPDAVRQAILTVARGGVYASPLLLELSLQQPPCLPGQRDGASPTLSCRLTV